MRSGGERRGPQMKVRKLGRERPWRGVGAVDRRHARRGRDPGGAQEGSPEVFVAIRRMVPGEGARVHLLVRIPRRLRHEAAAATCCPRPPRRGARPGRVGQVVRSDGRGLTETWSPPRGKLVRMDHHFVPQFYLRGFRDTKIPTQQGPRVWVADLKERTIQLRAPKSVAYSVDYYALPDPAKAQELEKALGRIESDAAPVVARLLGGQLDLSDQARAYLANFMALLVTRGPFFRDKVEDVSAQVMERMIMATVRNPARFERSFREANAGKELTPQHIEATRQRIVASGVEAKARPVVSLLPLVRVANRVFPLLLKMEWAFFAPAEEMKFLTCDTPLSWVDPLPPGPLGSGLAMRNVEVTFPVGPRLCLIATWREGNTGHAEVDDEIVHQINRRRVDFSSRFVFSDSEAGARGALETLDSLRGDDSARTRPE